MRLACGGQLQQQVLQQAQQQQALQQFVLHYGAAAAAAAAAAASAASPGQGGGGANGVNASAAAAAAAAAANFAVSQALAKSIMAAQQQQLQLKKKAQEHQQAGAAAAGGINPGAALHTSLQEASSAYKQHDVEARAGIKSALSLNLPASSSTEPQVLLGPDGKPFAPPSAQRVQVGGHAMEQVYVQQPGGGYVVYGQPPPFILGNSKSVGAGTNRFFFSHTCKVFLLILAR